MRVALKYESMHRYLPNSIDPERWGDWEQDSIMEYEYMMTVLSEVTFFFFSLTQHPMQHGSAVSKGLLTLHKHESLVGILE